MVYLSPPRENSRSAPLASTLWIGSVKTIGKTQCRHISTIIFTQTHNKETSINKDSLLILFSSIDQVLLYIYSLSVN